MRSSQTYHDVLALKAEQWVFCLSFSDLLVLGSKNNTFVGEPTDFSFLRSCSRHLPVVWATAFRILGSRPCSEHIRPTLCQSRFRCINYEASRSSCCSPPFEKCAHFDLQKWTWRPSTFSILFLCGAVHWKGNIGALLRNFGMSSFFQHFEPVGTGPSDEPTCWVEGVEMWTSGGIHVNTSCFPENENGLVSNTLIGFQTSSHISVRVVPCQPALSNEWRLDWA